MLPWSSSGFNLNLFTLSGLGKTRLTLKQKIILQNVGIFNMGHFLCKGFSRVMPESMDSTHSLYSLGSKFTVSEIFTQKYYNDVEM